MQSTTTLELNLQYPNHATTMYAVQNDRLSRKISAVLADGATAWTPPAGTEAIIRYVKPDGTKGFYDVDENDDPAVTWTGNVATIMLAEQVLTVAGEVWCQLNFYTGSEERLTTFKWKIVVQENVIDDETIISTDYFNILTQQIAVIEAALADVPSPSTDDPLMDGTASPGSASGFARGDHVHPTDTSRVPTTRKVNNKALSSDITLSASDVGAVPTTRKVNNKALSSDITLSASDVSAVPTTRTINNKALSSDITLSASDVEAVPTTRTVAGKALSSNVTLNASDIVNNSDVDGPNVDDALDNLNETIKYILPSTGDSTDRYSDIMGCLNTYGVCVLGDGVFYINSTIAMPDSTTLSGVGVGTVLQLKDSSSDQIAVNVGSHCLVKDMTIKGNSTELSYSSYTQGNRKGVVLLGDYTDFNTGTYSHNFAKLSNLTITDFDHSGIWAYRNDGSASFLADNIDILRCHTGINIEVFSEFHSFSNIRCRWCNIACVMQGGNNLFSNCHFDVNLMGIKIDGTNNGLINADHSSFVNCSVCHPDNNTGYSVWLENSLNGLLFSNCQFWYGKIYVSTCSGVKFSHNIIGGTNSDVTVITSNKVSFTDNLFKENSPSITLTSTIGLIWEDNINGNSVLIPKDENRGSISNLNSQVIQTGTYNSMQLEGIAICMVAGEFQTSLPLPFSINPSRATFTLTRVVIIGQAQISDISNVTISLQPNFVRVEHVPWTSAQLGDPAYVNIMGNLVFQN